MKKSLFVALLLGGFVAHAVTLGEYTGKGTLRVETKVEGRKSAYTSPCDLAFNITMNEKELLLDYSLFQCGGLNVWNDAPYAFDVVNGKLMRNGVEFGSTDGRTARFSISWQTQEKHAEYLYDENCVVRDVKYHNFNLDHSVGYTVSMTSNGYTVERAQGSQSVQFVYKKPNQNCQAQAVPVKAETSMQVSGSVSK